MRALAIKMKSYAEGVSSIGTHRTPLTLNILLFALGSLAVIYLFLLGNMVFNIIERKSLESEARTLSTQISAMEINYLELSNKIDINYSYSLGFKETKPTFATRKTLGALPSIKLMQNEI